MKKQFAFLILISCIGFQVSAQGLEECSKESKPLYMDILVYNKTEKMLKNDGLIGENLRQQLEMQASSALSIQEKVHSSEASFAQCNVPLTEDDMLAIDNEADTYLKMKSPLITD